MKINSWLVTFTAAAAAAVAHGEPVPFIHFERFSELHAKKEITLSCRDSQNCRITGKGQNSTIPYEVAKKITRRFLSTVGEASPGNDSAPALLKWEVRFENRTRQGKMARATEGRQLIPAAEREAVLLLEMDLNRALRQFK